jgi:lipopolysaccharide transport system permease protein
VTDATPRAKPLLVIKPRKGWLPAHPAELWHFRELLWRFAARDVTLRYRQTALGVAWVVLQPLLAAGILSFVFGKVANLPAPAGIPYFVFSLAGMTAWNAFSNTVTRAGGVLVANAPLVQKVFFPRLLLPISTVMSTLLDVAVSLVLTAILMAITGVAPGIALLLLPVWLLLILLLGLGLGLGAGALMVRYRDVQYVLPVAVQFLLYASPVAYSLSAVTANVSSTTKLFFELNPLTGLLEGFRWSLIDTQAPSAGLAAYAIVSSIVVLLVGLAMFNRMERQFADVI